MRSRGDAGDATRVDFEELAPDIDTFLGQAAYLQLGFFETLSELIAVTQGLADKEALSKTAAAAAFSESLSNGRSAPCSSYLRPLLWLA